MESNLKGLLGERRLDLSWYIYLLRSRGVVVIGCAPESSASANPFWIDDNEHSVKLGVSWTIRETQWSGPVTGRVDGRDRVECS